MQWEADLLAGTIPAAGDQVTHDAAPLVVPAAAPAGHVDAGVRLGDVLQYLGDAPVDDVRTVADAAMSTIIVRNRRLEQEAALTRQIKQLLSN